MYNTVTVTPTYTVVDIRKAFEGFEADLRMIARRTGKWSIEYTDKIIHDILRLAERKYLSSISVALTNLNEKVLRATKFTVNPDGKSITGERAGGNDWNPISDTTLTIILSYTQQWNLLTTEQKIKFQKDNDFKISWVTSNIDTTFSHLSRTSRQLYASNGFELKKDDYR